MVQDLKWNQSVDGSRTLTLLGRGPVRVRSCEAESRLCGCRLSGCLMVINELVCRQVSQNKADKKPGEFFLPVSVDTLLPPGAQCCVHTHHTHMLLPYHFALMWMCVCWIHIESNHLFSVVSLEWRKHADWPRLVTQLFDPTSSDLRSEVSLCVFSSWLMNQRVVLC